MSAFISRVQTTHLKDSKEMPITLPIFYQTLQSESERTLIPTAALSFQKSQKVGSSVQSSRIVFRKVSVLVQSQSNTLAQSCARILRRFAPQASVQYQPSSSWARTWIRIASLEYPYGLEGIFQSSIGHSERKRL